MNWQVVLRAPGNVAITQAPPVTTDEEHAVVEFRLGGICGSDVAAYRGVSPLVTYPRVLGHEFVVTVVEAPTKPQWEGCRAVVEPLWSCRQCRPCREGRYNCCVDLNVLGVHIDGGFQRIFPARLDRLHIVPDDMPDELAVLAEPMSIAYRAVQRSQIEAGQQAVVFGAGTIGLLIAHILLKARGCRVFIVDASPARLQRAETIGAIPLSGSAEQLTSALEQMTDGQLADVVFEATGHPDCTRRATDMVAFTGKIVLIGWNQGPVDVDTVTLMRKEASLLGSRNSTNAFPSVLRLLSGGIVDTESLITHDFRYFDIENAMTLLDKGHEDALKIILRP